MKIVDFVSPLKLSFIVNLFFSYSFSETITGVMVNNALIQGSFLNVLAYMINFPDAFSLILKYILSEEEKNLVIFCKF